MSEQTSAQRSTSRNARGWAALALGLTLSLPLSAQAIARIGGIDALGAKTQLSDDPNGNELSRTDRAGRSTVMEYDALDLLTETRYPDGSFSSSEYDCAGRVLKSRDRNGQGGRGSGLEFEPPEDLIRR